jgi:IS5 family transposase
MFKLLIIEFIYNLSDREIEKQLYYNMLFMDFCDFSSEDLIPDHSTISRWRDRFIKFNILEKLFQEFNNQLEIYGIEVRKGAIADATLIQSHARPRKRTIIESEPTGDEEIPAQSLVEENNTGDQETTKTVISEEISIDPDARFIKKGKTCIYGYKLHATVNSDGIFTSVITTPANVYDGHILAGLLNKANIEINTGLAADKGYDTVDNRNMLHQKGLVDFIMRKHKSKKNPDPTNVLRNKLISKIRYIIERSNGGVKTVARIGRSRYIGLIKTHFANVFGALVYNMRRCIKVIEHKWKPKITLPQESCV